VLVVDGQLPIAALEVLDELRCLNREVILDCGGNGSMCHGRASRNKRNNPQSLSARGGGKPELFSELLKSPWPLAASRWDSRWDSRSGKRLRKCHEYFAISLAISASGSTPISWCTGVSLPLKNRMRGIVITIVLHGDLRVLVHVQLADLHLAGILIGDLVDDRRELPARAAPGSPKIGNHKCAGGDLFVPVVGGEFDDVGTGHEHLPTMCGPDLRRPRFQ